MDSAIAKMIVVSLLALAVWAIAARAESGAGAIKKFVRFPVQTYELSGMLSKTRLEEKDVPSLSAINVTGIWPDRKFLLIELGGEAYYILYSSVEMIDQALWDDRMRATGNLVCTNGVRTNGNRQGDRDGTTPAGTPAYGTATASTKGFASPC